MGCPERDATRHEVQYLPTDLGAIFLDLLLESQSPLRPWATSLILKEACWRDRIKWGRSPGYTVPATLLKEGF